MMEAEASHADTKELAAYQAQLQELVTATQARFGIPGIALELFANGVRVRAAMGTQSVDDAMPIGADARFELGALNKVLLAAVTLELAGLGKLALDAPAAKLLNELEGTRFGEQVTLWHLLCHSGGYKSVNLLHPDVQHRYNWSKLVSFLRDVPFLFEPGTVYSYTVTAPVLVAEVIRRVTGIASDELVRDRLADAIGISLCRQDDALAPRDGFVASHVYDPRLRRFFRNAPQRLGDFWLPAVSAETISLADLASFAAAIVTARASDGSAVSLLDRENALLLQRQVLSLPAASGDPRVEPLPMSTGPGCSQYLPDWLGYNGPFVAAFSGQSIQLRYHARHSIAVAVGMNAFAPSVCEDVMRQVLSSLTGEIELPEPRAEEHPLSARELAGEYFGAADAPITVLAQGKELICELSSQPGAPKLRVLMSQDENGRWVVRSDANFYSLGFFREPAGGAPALMVGPSAYRRRGG